MWLSSGSYVTLYLPPLEVTEMKEGMIIILSRELREKNVNIYKNQTSSGKRKESRDGVCKRLRSPRIDSASLCSLSPNL
jgi:hypothetical protein